MRAMVAAISLAFAASASAQSVTSSILSVTPNYLSGLSSPTGLRFLGPNEGLVIEKGGAVKYFNGRSISTALELTVATSGERGLLGIALDPGFSTNRQVYLYQSTGSGSNWIDNRVTRHVWDPVTKMLSAGTLVRTFGSAATGDPDPSNHNGGVLTFGPDGKLYGTTGDLNRNLVEQNNRGTTGSAFAGGVFRIETDGSIPTDGGNKFTGDFAPWYTYGVRNSFGLAVDPVTGRLWNTENGETTFDEINLLESGMNSGWRPIQGPRGTLDPAATLNLLPGAEYVDPKMSFARAIGITSIQFVNDALGPAYKNAVLIGEAVGTNRLWIFRLNDARDGFLLRDGFADGIVHDGDLVPFGTGFAVTTDIQVGPNGGVYVVSLADGAVHRIALVPEPQIWALMLCGLAAAGRAARRRAMRIH